MKSLFIGIFTIIALHLPGQGVGINSNGSAPYAGAILDISSGNKGVLLPRTITSSIVNPIEGMVIYDTVSQVFQYYNGMLWLALLQEGSYSFWWADQDGDGYGYPFNVIYAPEAPEFYVGNNNDCDDTNATVNPGVPELCDEIDNDCDGAVDEGNPGGGIACGSNVGNCQQGTLTCINGELVCIGGVGPQPETCDGLDNDCDGIIDEDAGQMYYIDSDSDGFGDENDFILSCIQPSGYVSNNDDCDDTNVSIFPGAPEVCDGLDNDCDGLTGEGVC
ncbi:MAG: putative metal-binding motif-containing protein [Bacteroidota bacterium]|nr:putative metal-binding motif-containing protein [Bacteroidota bacterium]